MNSNRVIHRSLYLVDLFSIQYRHIKHIKCLDTVSQRGRSFGLPSFQAFKDSIYLVKTIRQVVSLRPQIIKLAFKNYCNYLSKFEDFGVTKAKLFKQALPKRIESANFVFQPKLNYLLRCKQSIQIINLKPSSAFQCSKILLEAAYFLGKLKNLKQICITPINNNLGTIQRAFNLLLTQLKYWKEKPNIIININNLEASLWRRLKEIQLLNCYPSDRFKIRTIIYGLHQNQGCNSVLRFPVEFYIDLVENVSLNFIFSNCIERSSSIAQSLVRLKDLKVLKLNIQFEAIHHTTFFDFCKTLNVPVSLESLEILISGGQYFTIQTLNYYTNYLNNPIYNEDNHTKFCLNELPSAKNLLQQMKALIHLKEFTFKILDECIDFRSSQIFTNLLYSIASCFNPCFTSLSWITPIEISEKRIEQKTLNISILFSVLSHLTKFQKLIVYSQSIDYLQGWELPDLSSFEEFEHYEIISGMSNETIGNIGGANNIIIQLKQHSKRLRYLETNTPLQLRDFYNHFYRNFKRIETLKLYFNDKKINANDIFAMIEQLQQKPLLNKSILTFKYFDFESIGALEPIITYFKNVIGDKFFLLRTPIFDLRNR